MRSFLGLFEYTDLEKSWCNPPKKGRSETRKNEKGPWPLVQKLGGKKTKNLEWFKVCSRWKNQKKKSQEKKSIKKGAKIKKENKGR